MRYILFFILLPLNLKAQKLNLDSLKNLSHSGNSYTIRCNALKDIANYFMVFNQDSALFYAEKLLEAGLKNKDSFFIYKGYWTKGNALHLKNNVPEAIQNFQMSLSFCDRETNRKNWNMLHALISSCLVDQQINFSEVRPEIIKNIALNKQEKDTAAEIFNLLNLAQTFNISDSLFYDTIDVVINHALNLCRKSPGSGAYFYNACNLIKVTLQLEKRDFGDKAFAKTVDSIITNLENEGNTYTICRVLNYKGLQELLNKNYRAVSPILNKMEKYVLDENAEKRPPEAAYFYYELKYKYEEAIGNYKSALEDSKKYTEANLNYINGVNTVKVNNLKSTYDLKLEQKNKEEKQKTIQQQKTIIGILGLLSALIIGFSIFIYRFNNSRKQQVYRRRMAEIELRALRAKLNPHFIQNTFDLIALQIRVEDPEEAVNRIRQVSIFLRNLLNKTETSLINVEDELEFSEKYLEIQLLIHPDLFNYHVEIPEEIDTFGIMVPTMLLQPILENCIKHGFKNIKTGGYIDIILVEKAGSLVIKVRDNGIGLKRAVEQELGKESVGVDLTKRRLSLLARTKTISDELVKIMNRTDGTSGTEVIITIPLANKIRKNIWQKKFASSM